MPALWIRRALADPALLQRQRIYPGRMPAAMLNKDRMIGRRTVEIANCERPTFGSLSVVVFEAEHPLARRSFLRVGPFPNPQFRIAFC